MIPISKAIIEPAKATKNPPASIIKYVDCRRVTRVRSPVSRSSSLCLASNQHPDICFTYIFTPGPSRFLNNLSTYNKFIFCPQLTVWRVATTIVIIGCYSNSPDTHGDMKDCKPSLLERGHTLGVCPCETAKCPPEETYVVVIHT